VPEIYFFIEVPLFYPFIQLFKASAIYSFDFGNEDHSELACIFYSLCLTANRVAPFISEKVLVYFADLAKFSIVLNGRILGNVEGQTKPWYRNEPVPLGR
jgi:hypothetical protein